MTEQIPSELPARERAEYLVDTIQETGLVWGLMGNEGWVMVELGTQTGLPLWPDEASVSSWQRKDLPESKPQSIALADFKELWLPGLKKNNVALVLFPSGTLREGIVTGPDELREQLDDE
ncbi:DUF2750 domain-containing protein [Aestuariibacter sp. GS-14]|uniref:DUF2750 domain-containing protein n=1 Tax=Alteromonadaceae TaxID=72275 RepID=UPI0015E8748A|nr:DUF2750 domain-containing protein [Aestuariibacter sp. GS-14]